MAEPNPNPNPTPDPKDPKAGEIDYTKVDVSKLSDEQLAKVLEDERLWKLPRMTELRDHSKEYTKLKKAQEEADKAKLLEDGKFKELLEAKEKENAELKAKAVEQNKLSKIQAAASALGVKDLDAASKLIDMSLITVDETTGEVKGVDDAVKALTTAKPYLLSGTPAIGTPTNPADPKAPLTTFTMSQLSDSKFYQEHRDEITKAQAIPGSIIEDRPGMTPSPSK